MAVAKRVCCAPSQGSSNWKKAASAGVVNRSATSVKTTPTNSRGLPIARAVKATSRSSKISPSKRASDRFPWNRLEAVLERLSLTRSRDLPFRSLSAGQQRRVGLARLLLSNASLWLMDEPFTNLDAAGQALTIELINEHRANDGACLFASHQEVELYPGMPQIALQ